MHTIDFFEFPSADLVADQAFFAAFAGWTFQAYGNAYVDFHGEGLKGGFYPLPAEKISSLEGLPMLVLKLPAGGELSQEMERVETLGGKIKKEIFSFPGGKRFEFSVPGGTRFALWEEA